ncbi:HNH endonuclease [Neptuniibacter sp. QD29_5]|uniref:HNH endonuclease n=1 Tax=Neptuniibacter sp. QD29_5 TaxID=3398207 RepID=UPI0039F63658
MKLTTDLSGLWANVERMGKFEANFNLQEDHSPDFELDKDLSSTAGLDIQLEDLELENGVLSVKGRQVLLFIPDQGQAIDEVLGGIKEGRKFHVADCKTLNSMRQKNRFNRYKATYNTSGLFKVYGVSYETGDSVEGEAELRVCKNCLSYLNYKGYRHGKGLPKKQIYNEYDISEFLSEYSTLFSSMPDRSQVVDKGGYSDDWAEVSTNYRATVNFCCEQCGVDLNSNKRLLHTHHISGNKRENHPDNLKALCIDCHRKQPHHDYMRVTHENMLFLNGLRREQGLFNISNWNQARNVADKAVDGLLRFYEKSGYPLPEINFIIKNNEQSTFQLEVAWPSLKKGIAISAEDIKAGQLYGWNVLSVGEALSEMNQ